MEAGSLDPANNPARTHGLMLPPSARNRTLLALKSTGRPLASRACSTRPRVLAEMPCVRHALPRLSRASFDLVPQALQLRKGRAVLRPVGGPLRSNHVVKRGNRHRQAVRRVGGAESRVQLSERGGERDSPLGVVAIHMVGCRSRARPRMDVRWTLSRTFYII
jgi:hypothetical protein